VRPHAVSSIAGTVDGIALPSYKYDANGNLVCVYTGSGCLGSGIVRESDQYWSFNSVKTVTEGTTAAGFVYDSEHQRITQTLTSGSTVATTTYLNDLLSGMFEEKLSAGATTTWSDYLLVDGKLVGERSCTGAAPCSTGASLQYFVTDHLGSVAVVTGAAGALIARESFDAWGRQRNANGTDDPPCALGSSAPTTRGFTGQEDMPSFCLVNLNARLYDPTIGRMMSADSLVPDPTDGQSFNRYTYVDNRPLSLTDPTGHEPDMDQNFPLGFGPCPCFVDPYFVGDYHPCWCDDGGRHAKVDADANGTMAFDQSAATADGEAITGTSPVQFDDQGPTSPSAAAQTDAAQNARGQNGTPKSIETVVVTAERPRDSDPTTLNAAYARLPYDRVERGDIVYLKDGQRRISDPISNDSCTLSACHIDWRFGKISDPDGPLVTAPGLYGIDGAYPIARIDNTHPEGANPDQDQKFSSDDINVAKAVNAPITLRYDNEIKVFDPRSMTPSYSPPGTFGLYGPTPGVSLC
jgi:RHS repeat-associated protein